MRTNEGVSHKYKHCFAITAYRESEFLEECIKSLLAQTIKTKVILCTPTPNDTIKNLVKKYNIEMYVRHDGSDMTGNWNFAYNKADADYVTLAHQDDVYSKKYVERFFEYLDKYEKTKLGKRLPVSIFFADYLPLKNGKIGTKDINCRLRRILRLPLKNHYLAANKIVKNRVLSLGNSIVCTTVTYNKQHLGESIFTSDLNYNVDWDTFFELGKRKGLFLYGDCPLVCYRIHETATSKTFIDNQNRYKEDLIMFEKFWCKGIARFIMKFYVKAYDTYD